MPDPAPNIDEQVREAWNASAPNEQWIVEILDDHLIVTDDRDRSFAKVPVMVGDGISFGAPESVRPGFVPATEPVAASMVFASRAESRPEAALTDPDEGEVAAHAAAADAPAEGTPPAEPPAPTLPAAEPEPDEVQPDPKEDPVSTDLSAFRSRLGLDDTADMDAVLSAVDALKAKADTPAEPTPEMVAASAAAEAEKVELRKEVGVLASRMEQVTTELATAKAEKAATVKASVFDSAVRDGKIRPAEREQWETDYDEAPAAITRILASIAVGTAVPVAASGVTGGPEPTVNLDDDALTEAFFGPGSSAKFKTQEA